jgi:hypothetical protein
VYPWNKEKTSLEPLSVRLAHAVSTRLATGPRGIVPVGADNVVVESFIFMFVE